MRTWLLITAWACVALAGCRTDPAIALLERDNRLLEDEIYRLRNQVEDLEMALDTAQCSTQGKAVAAPRALVGPELGPAATEAPRARAPATTVKPPAHPAPRENRPTPKPSAEGPMMPPEVFVPGITPPGGQRPQGPQVPDQPRPFPDLQEPREPGASPPRGKAGERVLRHAPVSAPVLADSRQVARITLGPSLGGGRSEEGKPGLTLLVEPRDAAGRVLAAPAEMSVVLLNPTLSGDAARVAQWDVTVDQAAGMIRRGEVPGVPLRLLLPHDPPGRSPLQLYVRYRTADGRQFQIDRPLDLPLPEDLAVQSIPVVEGPILEPDAAPPGSWQSAAQSEGRGAGSATTAGWTPNPSASRPESASNQSPGVATGVPRGETPRMAARGEDAGIKRPVWSPERR